MTTKQNFLPGGEDKRTAGGQRLQMSTAEFHESPLTDLKNRPKQTFLVEDH